MKDSKKKPVWSGEKGLRGEVAKLGSNVYTYGCRDQGNWYVKTTEAIAGYVGREYGREMRMLVADNTETTFVEPTEPKDGGTNFGMEKYKKELSRYYNKVDKYEERKAQVFAIIKGQCSLVMKNKVESVADYKTWERNDDVIKLQKMIKELSFLTVEVQYEYWTVMETMKNVMMVRQLERENLAMYYKRFINTAEVAESQWGTMAPTRLMKKKNSKSEEKECRDKFLACVFLAGVDRKRYGRLVNDLNNAFLAGQKNHPTTVEGAMTMLSHYTNEKPRQNEYGKLVETSFLQSGGNSRGIRCYRCGKRGHIARNCTDESSDDERSLGTQSVSWAG